MHTKRCARFGHNFSVLVLCPIKTKNVSIRILKFTLLSRCYSSQITANVPMGHTFGRLALQTSMYFHIHVQVPVSQKLFNYLYSVQIHTACQIAYVNCVLFVPARRTRLIVLLICDRLTLQHENFVFNCFSQCKTVFYVNYNSRF